MMRQYLDLLRDIVDEGEDVQSGAVLKSENRKPICRFLLAAQLRFDWVVDEVLWFLRGETNINTLGRKIRGAPLEPIEGEGPEGGYIETYVRRPIWDQWAKPDGDVPQIYGKQWRDWEYPIWDEARGGNPLAGQAAVGSWDQVAKIVADLKAVKDDPSNRARRRIILTAWNPPEIQFMGLPPCHTLAQFLPTNGYLDCVCHWRSIDTFTGMPFNIAQYAILTSIFAGVAGLIPRHLVCNIADCHVYDNQFEQIVEQCARTPFDPPYMVIDNNFWHTAPDLAPEQLRRVDPAWFRLEDYQYHKGKLKAEIAV
jgi:thymidylate synthase